MTNKHKLGIWIGIGIGMLAVFAVYFWLFFQKGIIVGDAFLLRHGTGQSTVYRGDVNGHETVIAVERESQDEWDSEERCGVIFSQEQVRKEYMLESSGEERHGLRNITVYEDGRILFEGLYDADGAAFPRVYENSGTPYLEDMISIRVDGEPDTLDGLTVYTLVDIFCGDEELRGDAPFLAVAVFILLVWIVDICFPDFFFQLRYAISVKDPEPSEWYRTVQKITWVIYPAAAAGFLLASVFG